MRSGGRGACERWRRPLGGVGVATLAGEVAATAATAAVAAAMGKVVNGLDHVEQSTECGFGSRERRVDAGENGSRRG